MVRLNGLPPWGPLAALQFLTRVPIRLKRAPSMSGMVVWFPVAGAVIGLAVGGVGALAWHVVPPLVAGTLAVTAGLLITGAFHEDGLADVADGFGGGATHDERLAIMRDSRIGAFGTLALVIVIPGRAALLAALLVLPPAAIVALLAGAAAFSRALMVDLLSTTRPARSSGLSVLAGQPSRRTGLAAIAIGGLAAGIPAAAYLSWEVAIVSLIAALLALGTLRALAMRKIGGQTGDVCGAGQVLSETAMLAVFAAAISFT